jgi:fumarate reductase subunit C
MSTSTQQTPIILDIAGEAAKQGLQGAAQHASADGGFGIFLGSMMNAAMVLAAVIAFAFMLWGAVEWITSAGDKSKMESARNKITNAVIGLIVLAAVVAIYIVLQQFLELEVLTFN